MNCPFYLQHLSEEKQTADQEVDSRVVVSGPPQPPAIPVPSLQDLVPLASARGNAATFQAGRRPVLKPHVNT